MGQQLLPALGCLHALNVTLAAYRIQSNGFLAYRPLALPVLLVPLAKYLPLLLQGAAAAARAAQAQPSSSSGRVTAPFRKGRATCFQTGYHNFKLWTPLAQEQHARTPSLMCNVQLDLCCT